MKLDQKYILIKFINGVNQEREPALLKCHSVWETENNLGFSIHYAEKGYQRKYGGFLSVQKEEYYNFKKVILIVPPDFIHDLETSMEEYLKFVVEKDKEVKKELEKSLSILDLTTVKFTEEEKEKHLKLIEERKNKRKRKKKIKELQP